MSRVEVSKKTAIGLHLARLGRAVHIFNVVAASGEYSDVKMSEVDATYEALDEVIRLLTEYREMEVRLASAGET